MKCPNCAKENMVLRMATTIDFDVDEDGRVEGVVNGLEKSCGRNISRTRNTIAMPAIPLFKRFHIVSMGWKPTG